MNPYEPSSDPPLSDPDQREPDRAGVAAILLIVGAVAWLWLWGV